MAGVVVDGEFYLAQFNDFAVPDNPINPNWPKRFEPTKVGVAEPSVFSHAHIRCGCVHFGTRFFFNAR